MSLWSARAAADQLAEALGALDLNLSAGDLAQIEPADPQHNNRRHHRPNQSPTEPPKPAPPKSGMNVITLEEMVEADTTLIPKPGNKGNPPAGPKK